MWKTYFNDIFGVIFTHSKGMELKYNSELIFYFSIYFYILVCVAHKKSLEILVAYLEVIICSRE